MKAVDSICRLHKPRYYAHSAYLYGMSSINTKLSNRPEPCCWGSNSAWDQWWIYRMIPGCNGACMYIERGLKTPRTCHGPVAVGSVRFSVAFLGSRKKKAKKKERSGFEDFGGNYLAPRLVAEIISLGRTCMRDGSLWRKDTHKNALGPAPPPPRSTPQGRGVGSPFPKGLDDKQRNAAKGWMMDEVRGQGKKTARALAGASVHEPTLLSTVLRQSRARQTGYIYI